MPKFIRRVDKLAAEGKIHNRRVHSNTAHNSLLLKYFFRVSEGMSLVPSLNTTVLRLVNPLILLSSKNLTLHCTPLYISPIQLILQTVPDSLIHSDKPKMLLQNLKKDIIPNHAASKADFSSSTSDYDVAAADRDIRILGYRSRCYCVPVSFNADACLIFNNFFQLLYDDLNIQLRYSVKIFQWK